jgi:hypothetical protein
MILATGSGTRCHEATTFSHRCLSRPLRLPEAGTAAAIDLRSCRCGGARCSADRHGLLEVLPQEQKAEVRLQLIDTAVEGYLDTEWNDDCVAADLRSYPADNENLAEGDIGVTILLMKSVLEQEGVKLKSVEDEFGGTEDGPEDEGYRVVINGEPHEIYESEAVSSADIWILSLERLLQIVNGLLEDAGSHERLYGMYGGNDGRVILLTPEMHDYIESMGDVFDPDWMPYSVESIEVGDRP